MSYLLAQILICLLIAGLIGAIIGWFLRGDCSAELQECEDEWKIRVGSLESEWNARIKTDDNPIQSPEIESILSDEYEEGHATLKKKYQEEKVLDENISDIKTHIDNDSKDGIINTIAATTVASTIAAATNKEDDKLEGINLSESKIALYKENDIDLENTPHLDDEYDVQAIEGIGPKYASILKSLGVHTTQDLVNTLHKNQNEIQKFANELDVKPETILSWISMADIIKLPGVDGQAAELLQTVGISSVTELAVTNPHSLHNEMVAFNKKSPIVPEVPTLNSVTLWTKIAKYL